MPIEIRELIIKATVDQSQGAGGGPAATGKSSSAGSGGHEDMIRECVDKVLAILNEKNER